MKKINDIDIEDGSGEGAKVVKAVKVLALN